MSGGDGMFGVYYFALGSVCLGLERAYMEKLEAGDKASEKGSSRSFGCGLEVKRDLS